MCEMIYLSHLIALSCCNSYQKTIHQFYLQLREDILSGQLHCHEEASFKLGGIALQAETGDYNDTLGDEYFLSEHYVPSRVCSHVKTAYLNHNYILVDFICLKCMITRCHDFSVCMRTAICTGRNFRFEHANVNTIN